MDNPPSLSGPPADHPHVLPAHSLALPHACGPFSSYNTSLKLYFCTRSLLFVMVRLLNGFPGSLQAAILASSLHILPSATWVVHCNIVTRNARLSLHGEYKTQVSASSVAFTSICSPIIFTASEFQYPFASRTVRRSSSLLNTL